jgi:alpha-tubulin suppressor-like RCC1 family protein
VKPAVPDNRNGVTPLRVLLALLLCGLLPLFGFAAAPAWWSERGVTVNNATPDDYAPANHGQLKNIAKAAVAEMDAKLSGGAGPELHTLVTSWSIPSPQTNDFAPLNIGQLKNVAKPFYDRLIAAGLANAYPWTGSVVPADDFGAANIGQVKNLFSFEIPSGNMLADPLTDRIAASQRAGNLALETQAIWFWGNRLVPDSNFQTMFPRTLTGLPALKSVSLGDDHFAVLAADGTVLTWGQNNLGQLGDGTNVDRAAPTPLPNLVNIISLKAGGAHTLVLQQGGSVLAWGDNGYGQLGTGDTTPSNIPVQVLGLTEVSRLAAGPSRSVALKSDGTVWTWGYEHYSGQDIFSPTPVQMPDLSSVVDIAVGYEHVVAVKADGSVWAWGSNYSHQIGDGSSTGSYHQTPVQVPGLINVVKVASSWDHTLAVASDGTVWAWGYNASGQLGDGTTDPHPAPLQVTGLTGVIAIATSWSYSMAMEADGTVWAWGDGASGTLAGVDLHVPQQVGLGLLDTNQNGMDDRWEMEYFGNLDQGAGADFDGDGISNLQEYLQGTDPSDYFNGTTPMIEIVSGNNQLGEAGAIAPQPLDVLVKSANGQLAPNAPVTFTVSLGDAQLLGGSNGQEMTVRTDADGIALVQVAFGASNGLSSRVSALAGKSINTANAVFRVRTNYRQAPIPTPTPDPNASPTPTPSPTATPSPPYRYAVIDLGKDMRPIRVNNKGWVLLDGTRDGQWGYFRWKAGVLEQLTYTPENSGIWATDMNDEGVVVGAVQKWGEWIDDAENEPEAGLQWPANTSEAVKISAPVAASSWDWRNPGTIRQGSFSALSNKNAAGQAKAYGRVRTGGGFGFLFSPFSVINAYRWSDFGSPVELSHSVATPFFDEYNNIIGFSWTGFIDTVSRANSSDHYIGRQETPPPAEWWFYPELHGPITGMIDGQAVDFGPEDLNESGVVVGNRTDGGPMVIRTLAAPPSEPSPDVVLPGAYPVAINTHMARTATDGGSPTPTPTPTPAPAPQILGWDGSATVLWERQPDDRTWHGFGLEDMIPSMDGWEIWDINDMNDNGVIVGTGSYKDPAHPTAPAEGHAFLLVPVELNDVSNGQVITDIAWIKGHTSDDDAKPEMPKLQVQFVGAAAEWQVEWKLKNQYSRRGGKDDFDLPKAAEPAIIRSGDQPWKMWEAISNSSGPKFFGGDVKVKYTVRQPDGGTIGSGELTFKIRGENPADDRCKARIIENQGPVWYAWAVAKHESRDSSGIYNQFANGRADGTAGAHGARGEPFYSPQEGNGWGLFQRDESSGHSVTTEETWSWDGNMKGFVQDEYPEHLRIANNYVDGVKRNNPDTFEEPQFTIEGINISGRDVLALTSYNGLQLPPGQGLSARLTFHSGNPAGQRWTKSLPNAPGDENLPYVNLILRAFNE